MVVACLAIRARAAVRVPPGRHGRSVMIPADRRTHEHADGSNPNRRLWPSGAIAKPYWPPEARANHRDAGPVVLLLLRAEPP